MSDFTDAKEPLGRGKDSDVYISKDGKHVIKVSKGKENLKKFRPDIDAVSLFNYIFPESRYEVSGYGEVDGKFVKFLKQPIVDFTDSKPLSAEERIAYMDSMGFKPINKEKTAFSNGTIVVADLQGNNIVRDKAGNIRVIDADVKLHTKDFGGQYSYPPVEADTALPQANDGGKEKPRFFRTPDGEAYGFTVGGKIYVDPRIARADTPIHEYTHLWGDMMRRVNPKAWSDIVRLMKGKGDLWEWVKENYPELKTDDEIADEVLAQFSGKRGAERLREEMRKVAEGDGSITKKAAAISALARVKEALGKFWRGVAELLHIRFTTAEEVADRVLSDLLHGVDPRKVGNEAGANTDGQSGKVRMQFVGERGAERADHAEEVSTRLDNLSVARKMETDKKDAKTIKMATGWERGADGKWRYEIPDLKLKGAKKNGNLSGWIDAPELFKAYPELEDVKVVVRDDLPEGVDGGYDRRSNTITVNSKLDDASSALAHEIQHAVQHTEGFASGGDLTDTRKTIEKVIADNQDASDYAKDKLKEWATLNMEADRLVDLYKAYINSSDPWLKKKAVEAYWNAMNELDNNERSTLTNEYPDGTAQEIAESGYHVAEAEKELRRLAKAAKDSIPEGNMSAMELANKLSDVLKNNTDKEIYRKLGGEVESRNVERRMSMTPEERRASLAADTEDVAREDQIFLDYGSQKFSLRDKNSEGADIERVNENDEKSGVRPRPMMSALVKAASTIRGWILNNRRDKLFSIELPEATQRMIRKVMGRDFDSHNITANSIAHIQKNHGTGGNKLDSNSIPLRREDMELIPYIMVAPDYVKKGNVDVSGRVSIRFYKNLSNGYVVVAEKEYKNSPHDMETITMWAEKSDKATNARLNAAPDTHVQNAILDIDAAKIREDAELAIENDKKTNEQPQNGNQKLSLRGGGSEDKTLAGVHNISEDKLRKALKLGGLANPSLAVVDTDKNDHSSFGEISLIAPSSLVDKRSGRTAGTWSTDAYTQRYPQVERQMSDKGHKKFKSWVSGLDFTNEEKREIERQTKDALESGKEPDWGLMYLHDKGVNVKGYSSQVGRDWEKIIEEHPTAEDIIKAMEQDPDLNDKVSKLAWNETVFPIRNRILLEVREQIMKETGERLSPISPRVKKAAGEIFDRDYAPTLLGADGKLKAEDVKKVVEQMVEKYDATKRYDFQSSKSKANAYIQDNGLHADYLKWMDAKLGEFGVKGNIFRGFKDDGTRKYVPETLDNVSRVMREEAQGMANGGEYTSFGSFIAKFAPRVDGKEEMRDNKGRLATDEAKQAFYDKWEDTYYGLAEELGRGDAYSGEMRLHDIAMQTNPKEYAKKEYGITLSDSFVDKLNALKKAIREDLKSPYFETKFERPVKLGEFTSAVVPKSIDAEVRRRLEEAGLTLYDYDPQKEGDRKRAFDEATQDDGVRFRDGDDDPQGGKPNETLVQSMTRRVKELAAKLGAKVRIVTSADELAAAGGRRMRRMKGMYDSHTGEVTIVVGNHENLADVENTVLHEVVGHRGFRILFKTKEALNHAMDELYRVSSDKIRTWIDKQARKMYDEEVDRIMARKRKEHASKGEDPSDFHLKDMADAHIEAAKKKDQFRRIATEEYGAHLAGRIGEKGFEKMSAEEQTFWGKLKSMLQKALQRLAEGLNITSKHEWSDKDWAYVLHEAYKREKNGGRPSIFDEADTIATRMRTGFGEGDRKAEAALKQRVRDKITELFEKAKTGEFSGKPKRIGRLSPKGKAFLEGLSGLKLKPYVDFVLNPSDLRHIRSDHYGENEKDKGNNVPLTDEDIRNMVDVLSEPDGILYGIDGKDSRKLFFFLKEAENGLYNLAEVCSTRNGNLTAKSFFKSKKKGINQRVMEIEKSLLPTSSTYSGESLSSETKIPTLFDFDEVSEENISGEDKLFRDSEDEDPNDGLFFRDGDDDDIGEVDLGDAVDKMRDAAAEHNANNLQAKRDAMKAIGGNLSKLRHSTKSKAGTRVAATFRL